MKASKAPLERWTLLVAALAAALAAPAAAHSGKSLDIDLEHELRLAPGSLELVQTQHYKGKMASVFLVELDRDRDGRVSPAEAASGETEGARQFLDAVGVEVDWLPAEPLSVTATFLALPARSAPGAEVSPSAVRVTARYRVPQNAGVHVLSLRMASLNAYHITGSLEAAPPLTVLRANAGEVTPDGSRVTGMSSTNGKPEDFQVMFSTRAPGAPPPAPVAPGSVPAWAAALAGALLFAAGMRAASPGKRIRT